VEDASLSKPAEETAAFDLGEMLGRRQAFGTVAGRCSAADAECLRRIREQKLYLQRAATWQEFCPQYLGLSRSQANRMIKLLEEFGPGYFELAQLTGITPQEFRAIAPAIHDQRIHTGGGAIALIPENSDKVCAAVQELRRAAATPAIPAAPSMSDRIAAVERRCNQVAAELRVLLEAKPGGLDNLTLKSVVRSAVLTMKRVELEMGL